MSGFLEVFKLTENNNEFVIIKTGGKQYIVETGTIISVEKLPESKSKNIKIEDILFHSKSGSISVGQPKLDISVSAEILANETDKKVRVFKFKPKTGYKKKQGHRQTYTTLKITSIDKASAKKETKAASTSSSKSSEKVEDKAKKQNSKASEKNK
jgi:large subunit ribosomal protein L21